MALFTSKNGKSSLTKLSQHLFRRLLAPLSAAGSLAGACFWFAALSPSLIPRNGLMQGAIGGLCFGVGYALTVMLIANWRWIGFSLPGQPLIGILRKSATLAAMGIILTAAFLGDRWQNAVRAALEMPPAEPGWPIILLAAGLGLMALLLLAGRVFMALTDVLRTMLLRVLPRRAAGVLAAAVAAWVFWAIGNGFLLEAVLRGLDSSYRRIDALIPADAMQPDDPLKSGSAASLLAWDQLGREGRRRVLSSPAAAEISHLTGRPAKNPLLVYVGLNSADTPEARAALALAEMKRIGAFRRKILVIATPTGTGWVDPAGMLPLEVMHGGDVASVSVQYSYLPSWLTLFVDSGYGEETANAVFQAVYGYWRAMPKEERPRLFLFGLSLGSLNSDLASDAYSVLGDPFEGALWAGPPFASRTWPQVTATRQAGSPAWLPEARHRGVFRFFTAEDRKQLAAPGWGPVKILYLQYPSDPISFFETGMWRREPDWMKAPRGPGVSPALTWLPGISFIQLAFDMMTATTVPKGRGHVFAAKDYAEGWRVLTAPEDFDDAAMTRLEEWLARRGL